MTLQEAIQHPRVNVYDISRSKSGKFEVRTYRKPGETDEEFSEREYKNFSKSDLHFNKQK